MSYTPGSVFKLLTAVAGARAGKSNLSFNCDGEIMIEGRFMGMLGKGESEPAAEKFQKEFTEKFLAGVRCECRTRPVSFSHLLNR